MTEFTPGDNGQQSLHAKENAPEAEISLNPEALRVQRNASAHAIVERAVEFVRRQGSATERIIDLLEYKALREEVKGFMLASYELQLEEALVRAQQPSEAVAPDPSPEPAETVPVEEPAFHPVVLGAGLTHGQHPTQPGQ